MKTIKLFLPFILILVLIGKIFPIFGYFWGENFSAFNSNLEGINVIYQTKASRLGEFPEDSHILLAGTSRTIADFDPKILREEFKRILPDRETLSIYNVGYSAMNMEDLIIDIKKLKAPPKVLVLEFAPFIFTKGEPEKKQSDIDKKIGLFKGILTNGSNGILVKIFGLETMPDVNDIGCIFSETCFGKSTFRDKWFIIQARHYGTGNTAGEFGHVRYFAYLKDEKDSAKIKDYVSANSYLLYKNSILPGNLNEQNIQSFMALSDYCKQKGIRLIVVRPPIDPDLYALENEIQKKVIDRVVALMVAEKIPYIDLNPHTYHLTDLSHVDWYDTARVSKQLFEKLLIYMGDPAEL